MILYCVSSYSFGNTLESIIHARACHLQAYVGMCRRVEIHCYLFPFKFYMNNTELKKPSRLSFFWWSNYFSNNPSTVFLDQDKDVYYDRQGVLHYPNNRSTDYWLLPHTNCCYCGGCYIPPSYGSGQTNDCGGNDCDGLGIVVLVLLALVALILAAALVFSYPPIMIISWIILVIGSIVENIVDTSPYCTNVRIYNLTSAITCLVLLILVTTNVFRMQRYYRHYYPGTPGVKVDVDSLIRLFRSNAIAYVVVAVLSTGMTIWGISWILKQSGSTCSWTYTTHIAWIVVHFLNMVAAIAMHLRMQKKYQVLSEPPAYSDADVDLDLATPAPHAIITQPPPPYLDQPKVS